MREITTINVRVLPPEDLIDFPCSNVFRDHYSSQGLTYPSGQYQRSRPTNSRSLDSKSEPVAQNLDELRQELQGWKSKAMDLEARCARLEEALHRMEHPANNHVLRGLDVVTR